MTNPFATTATATPPAEPAAQAAPVTPAAQPTGDDPFSGPAPQQARGPRLADVYGRLLLLVPTKLEVGIPNRLQAGTVQDRMTTDVVVLDGGPINYGGAPEKRPPVAHDRLAQTPHKTSGMYISSVGLISQCREALARRAQGQPGMVLGRLATGTAKEPGQNAPWLLTPPTDADRALARQYLAQVDPFA